MIQLMAQRRVLFFDATINKRSDIDFFLQFECLSVPVKWRRPEAGRAAERAQPPATEQPRQLARRLPLGFLPSISSGSLPILKRLQRLSSRY